MRTFLIILALLFSAVCLNANDIPSKYYPTYPVTDLVDIGEGLYVQAPILAFPSAEGFGKFTTGGRGGTVIHVTTLADSGAGSLREALTTTGARTVVFDVGGTITISTELAIGNGGGTANLYEDITIAGETAPSPGITINNHQLIISSSNVIIRNITIRGDPLNATSNAISMRNWGTGNYNQNDIILDHLTLSHAGNENFGFGGFNDATNMRNITIQNCMMGKTIGDGNILIGPNTQNVTFYRNYFHDAERRNPFTGYGNNDPLDTKELINNVVFNAKEGIGLDRGLVVDYIGNTFTTAVGSPTNVNIHTLAAYYTAATGFTDTGSVLGDGSYYLADNDVTATYTGGADAYNAEILSQNELSRVVTGSYISTWVTGRDDIANSVLPTVGNNMFRETLDQSLIDNYYTRISDYTLPTKPTKSSTARAAGYDTDNDGMADSWEVARYGDLTKGSWGYDDITGYTTAKGQDPNDWTNLEKFMFSLTGDIFTGVAPPPTVQAAKKKIAW